jgi:hypothetical protein
VAKQQADPFALPDRRGTGPVYWHRNIGIYTLGNAL